MRGTVQTTEFRQKSKRVAAAPYHAVARLAALQSFTTLVQRKKIEAVFSDKWLKIGVGGQAHIPAVRLQTHAERNIRLHVAP